MDLLAMSDDEHDYIRRLVDAFNSWDVLPLDADADSDYEFAEEDAYSGPPGAR